MQSFNIPITDIFQAVQSIQASFVYKGIFALILLGYIIFHMIILAQIHSMNKIITQPVSSSILGLTSVIQITLGIALLLFVLYIPI